VGLHQQQKAMTRTVDVDDVLAEDELDVDDYEVITRGVSPLPCADLVLAGYSVSDCLASPDSPPLASTSTASFSYPEPATSEEGSFPSVTVSRVSEASARLADPPVAAGPSALDAPAEEQAKAPEVAVDDAVVPEAPVRKVSDILSEAPVMPSRLEPSPVTYQTPEPPTPASGAVPPPSELTPQTSPPPSELTPQTSPPPSELTHQALPPASELTGALADGFHRPGGSVRVAPCRTDPAQRVWSPDKHKFDKFGSLRKERKEVKLEEEVRSRTPSGEGKAAQQPERGSQWRASLGKRLKKIFRS